MKTNLRTVLIVDDTPEDQTLCRRYLAKDASWQYEFLAADTSREALQLIQTKEPDCLLLDYALAEGDGLTLLAQLAGQANAPALPVVMLTGSGDLALAVEALKRGAQDYLVKGRFTAEELQRAINHAVEKVALLRQRDELLEKERAARAEAEAANRAKDEFLALVSHELRNPLNIMLGWTRTLRGHADPQVVKVVEIVARAAKNQQQLIEDLLDSARLLTGKLRLDARPLNLLSVVRAAVEVARPAAEAKRIQLVTDYQITEEQVTGDADRLQQVVWNLLSNAVKFTPEDGVVTVQLERRPPHVCVVVSDTGRGIKPELAPHLFERFRQGADAGGAMRSGGLGLGLSLVKQLVELHGGTVAAQSDGAGQGATFTVCLPLRAVRGETERPPGGATEGQEETSFSPSLRLTGVRILVLDDESDARSVITRTFVQCGAEVRAVASGPEAMQVLTADEWRPDLLVCDIQMPEEDGYAFMQRVRQLTPEQGGALPAIALTAFNQRQDRVQALQVGYQFHLAKPVEPLELALTVASLLNRPA